MGPGMLDAAVSGNVFASPSTAQIFAALRGVRKRNGYAEDHSIIMIIMNYTGEWYPWEDSNMGLT